MSKCIVRAPYTAQASIQFPFVAIIFVVFLGFCFEFLMIALEPFGAVETLYYIEELNVYILLFINRHIIFNLIF